MKFFVPAAKDNQVSAYQDEVLAFVNLPLETPRSALAQYVN
ncbi:hypothetical protein [Nostoc sp. C052]|nr:hypothetical protein [Nostoc sp. C052]